MKPPVERIDVGTKELNQSLERVRELLSEEDYRKLKAAVGTLDLTELVADKFTTGRRLANWHSLVRWKSECPCLAVAENSDRLVATSEGLA